MWLIANRCNLDYLQHIRPPKNDKEESTIPANIVLYKFGWIRCRSGQTLDGIEDGFACEKQVGIWAHCRPPGHPRPREAEIGIVAIWEERMEVFMTWAP